MLIIIATTTGLPVSALVDLDDLKQVLCGWLGIAVFQQLVVLVLGDFCVVLGLVTATLV